MDAATRALIVQMIRIGALSEDDVRAMHADLSRAGEGDAATQVGLCLAEAIAPNASDWEADSRRARFRVVEGDRKPTGRADAQTVDQTEPKSPGVIASSSTVAAPSPPATKR